MFGKQKHFPMSARAVSQGKSSRFAGCFLLVFFGMFFTAGCAFFFFMFLWPMMRIMGARDWVETPCVIVSSEVGVHSDSDGSTYSIDIEYTYFVDGRQHKSDRYSFDRSSSSGRGGKQRIVDQHPVGSEHVCYVDPDDPDEAVLNRGFVPTLWLGLLPLIFVAVGGGGLLFCTWGALTKRGPSRTSETEWLPDKEQSRVETQRLRGYVPERDTGGPVTLKPAVSPWGKLLGALVFALFWNGITSVFVTIAVTSHLKGDPEWFLTIFIIPFVLVGLGMIIYVLYSLLALFTPQPVVTISSGSVRLGESIELSWMFGGAASSIRQLTITVCGRESATYRRGTSTYTDTNVFVEIPAVDATDYFNIQRGESEVHIPADTMHSFESDHNKIEWLIKVKGDIAMWPDVNNSYPILVLP
jgi:hypothetical protein